MKEVDNLKKIYRRIILILCLLICTPIQIYGKEGLQKPTHLNISLKKNEEKEYNQFILSWVNPKSIQDKVKKNIPVSIEVDLKNNGNPWHSDSKQPLMVTPFEGGKKSKIVLDENSFATVKEFNAFLSNYSFRVRYRIGEETSPFSSYVSVGLRPTLKNVSSWALNSLNQANKLGLVPNSVKSDLKAPITREEFAHVLILTYEKKAGKVASINNDGFLDAKQAHILKAKSLGLIAGQGDNRFNPKGKITREEMAVMINKLTDLLGQKASGSKIDFKDASEISSWSKDSVDKVTSMGLIKGSDGKFMPKKNTSRQEALIVAYGLLDLK